MHLTQTRRLIATLRDTLTAHCETYGDLLDQVQNPHLFSAVRCILQHRRDADRQLTAQTTTQSHDNDTFAATQAPDHTGLVSNLMRGEGVFLLTLIQAEKDLLEQYVQVLNQGNLDPDFRALLTDQQKIVELNIRYLQIEQQQAA